MPKQNKDLSPTEVAQDAGLESIAQAVRMLGTKEDGLPVVPKSTLFNWYQHKPLLFRAVMDGLAVRLKRNKGRED